ncbi:MAG: hypothetical protein JWN70_5735 [Planctomycetaceae bacterium]|nr:hypothetical protein [Planctomycetaceae bacterium]
MTVQTPDLFQYRDIEYDVVGVSNGELFDEYSLDVELVSPSTSCARGYQAIFRIADHHLVVNTLLLCVYREGPANPAEPGPLILGAEASDPSRFSEGWDYQYNDLDHRLDYSGGVLIGDGFVPEFIMPLCQPRAWDFINVSELIFYRGILVEQFDRTAEVAEIRRQAGSPRTRTDRSELLWGAQLDRFIRGSFAEEYRV